MDVLRGFIYLREIDIDTQVGLLKIDSHNAAMFDYTWEGDMARDHYRKIYSDRPYKPKLTLVQVYKELGRDWYIFPVPYQGLHKIMLKYDIITLWDLIQAIKTHKKLTA